MLHGPTFLAFLAKSELRITKLDGESRLPAVITHAREGWVPWESQTYWIYGTRRAPVIALGTVTGIKILQLSQWIPLVFLGWEALPPHEEQGVTRADAL